MFRLVFNEGRKMCIPFLNEGHLLGKVRWIIFLILVKTVDIKLLREELGDRKREQNCQNLAVCIVFTHPLSLILPEILPSGYHLVLL